MPAKDGIPPPPDFVRRPSPLWQGGLFGADWSIPPPKAPLRKGAGICTANDWGIPQYIYVGTVPFCNTSPGLLRQCYCSVTLAPKVLTFKISFATMRVEVRRPFAVSGLWNEPSSLDARGVTRRWQGRNVEKPRNFWIKWRKLFQKG